LTDTDTRRLHLDALEALEEADLALFAAEMPLDAPHRLEDISREWAEGVFAAAVPGASLLGLTPEAGHNGMTNRRKWSMVWNEAGKAAGLPELFFVKATPDAGYHRESLALLHMGQTEVAFYREIQPTIPDIAPKSYYGAAYPGGRYIVLLEDLEARGLTPHWMADDCTIEHAMAVATAMAEYHALYWESPLFATDLSWIRPRGRRYGRRWHAAGMVPARIKFLDTDFAEGFTPDLRRLVLRYNEIFLDLYDYWDTLPATLVHGDSHLGNSFSTPDGRAGMFDWQLVFRGSGFRDLAYFVYSALTPDQLQADEQAIFDHYLGQLAARGVVLDRAKAWRDYCLLILERLDSLIKSTTHGMYGHKPKAYRRQAESIPAALAWHDVAGLLEAAIGEGTI
jgi:hypothetical protein